jgi:putative transposase
MCRVLGVSASGYYAWLYRPPSDRDLADEWLLAKIKKKYDASRGTYGAPRILHDLRDEGIHVGRKRIARLMRRAGLQGISRRKGFKTTTKDPKASPADDLVERDFSASGPDELWVSDITFVPTYAGFLFVAVVMDAWSRRIIGWSMATHLRTELVLDALEMALTQRRPKNVIHHSDHGCQYTSLAFGRRCREAGVRPSMGSVGDAFDNAMCESFFATLECELLDRNKFHGHSEARMAIFSFIEGFYNPTRRHSGIDYLSPINYERRYFAQA